MSGSHPNDDKPSPSGVSAGTPAAEVSGGLDRRARVWSALSVMSDAVLISDQLGHVIEFNEAFSLFHKFSSKQECAKTLAEFDAVVEVRSPTGQLVPVSEWPVPRALRGETGTQAQYDLQRRDTGERWSGSYNFAPIVDDAGAIIGCLVTVRDITAEKAALEKIQQSDRKFRELYDIVPVGIVLTSLRDGRYLDFNEAFCRLTGYEREKLLTLDVWALTPPEYHDRERSMMEVVGRKGHFGPYEKEYVRQDGSRLHLNLNGASIAGENGEECAWSIVEDITDRKRLREVDSYYAAIIESSTDAIIGKDLNGLITTWNPAARDMFGYEADEVVGRHVSLLFPPDRLAEENFIMGKIRQGDRVAQMTTVRLRKNGQAVPVMLTVSPIRAADGEIIGASKILRDLTQQLHTEAQLQQAQKMEAIGNMTGGLAHDFNNLLGIIMGNLELLESRLAEVEHKEMLHDALEAASRGAELTRGLLAFARRQPLQLKTFYVEHQVDETVKLLRRLLGDHIEISVRHEYGVCAVTADPILLSTALTNLATNARDAMPGGGKLTIETQRRRVQAQDRMVNFDIPPGEYAVIAVSDTGAGIAPDAINRIFEPFFTTKGRDEGTGLGLSMVFGFMKQSGGHINVYSELGHGATFRLYLPCDIDPALSDPAPSELKELRGRGERILVVEDNAALRRIVRRQLKELGYVPSEAANGVEALAALQSISVDLVLTDVVMPGGIDGYELARQVKRQWPQIAVVLTSGFPERSSAPQGGDSNLPLLIKPYRENDLARVVRRALDDVARPTKE